MATLSQLYNAYLQDDPNVGEMTYDPFGWNIEQTFADQDDDTGDGGGGGGGTGGDDPMTGGTFGPFGEGTIMDPKDFGLDNVAVNNPYYMPNDPLNPMRLRGMEPDPEGYGLAESIIGDRGLRTIRKRKEKKGLFPFPVVGGILKGITSIFRPGANQSAAGVGGLYPSEANLYDDLLQAGMLVDHGNQGIKTMTGKNVVSGYEEGQQKIYDKYLAKYGTEEEVEEYFAKNPSTTSFLQKQWAEAKFNHDRTKIMTANTLRRMKKQISDTPIIPHDVIKEEPVIKEELVPDASAIAGMDDAGMDVTHFADDEIKVGDLFTPSKINIEKARIGMPEHLTSDIEREEDRLLIELAKEKEKKKLLMKEKLAIASMDDAGMGVTHPEGPNISDLLTKTPLEQMIAAESKEIPDRGNRDVPSGGGQPQTGGYERGDYGGRGYHWAQGGRVRYSKGGIVDLL